MNPGNVLTLPPGSCVPAHALHGLGSSFLPGLATILEGLQSPQALPLPESPTAEPPQKVNLSLKTSSYLAIMG